jgi:hypothetical protein
MYPEGIEVYYRGHKGIIKFSCPDYVSICIRVFPDEPVRNVCLICHKSNFDEIELVIGNHSRQDD